MKSQSILIVGAVFTLIGCTGGEPLHRFTFDTESLAPQTTTLMLDKGEKVYFWNSLNVTYKQPASIAFHITIEPQNASSTEILCDALNPTLTFASVTIEKGNYVDKSWKIARMNCEYGPTTQQQTVTITATPKVDSIETLQFNELILDLKH